MLAAQLIIWLLSEMVVYAKALKANTTIKIHHENMRPMVLAAVEVFSEKAWNRHLSQKQTVWTPGARKQKKDRRANGDSLQKEVYGAIKGKSAKRERSTAFGPLTAKRVREH